jgi:hypothetical protein
MLRITRLKLDGLVSIVSGLFVANMIEHIAVEHFDRYIIAATDIRQVLVDQLDQTVQVLATVLYNKWLVRRLRQYSKSTYDFRVLFEVKEVLVQDLNEELDVDGCVHATVRDFH